MPKTKFLYWITALGFLAIIPSILIPNLTPEALNFLLFPTAITVDFFSSGNFYFDAGRGYVSDNLNIIIGTTCSGLSILLLFLFLLSVFIVSSVNTLEKKIFSFLFWLPAIYFFVILANTLRILLAIAFKNFSHNIPALGKPMMHEIAGILWYVITLIAFWQLLNKTGTSLNKNPKQNEMVT